MQYLWYEHLSESYPRCNVFKFREQSEILTYTLHEDISHIIAHSAEYRGYDHFFLLDESRFSFFRTDVFCDFEEPITIESINALLQEKVTAIKQEHHLHGPVVTNYVDTIFVNGEEKKFLIGQKGQIFFRLYVVFLVPTTNNLFGSVYGNVLQQNNIHLVPQSFYTLLFLRKTLKKEDFILLYITETYAKAIVIKQGFYSSVEVLNLGIGALKQMYKDNGVVQYWNKEASFIEGNSLAKGLVVETLEFYSQLFCKWLSERGIIGSDIIVISPITKNVHFIETFDHEYKKLTNNYIVPFHHSSHLKTFDRVWEPEEMDTLIFANQEEKIRKTLLGNN